MIAEAEAAVSVNEKKWLVMHMHVQRKLDELRGPPNPWLTVTMKVPGQLLPFCWAGCCSSRVVCMSSFHMSGGYDVTFSRT
jgi:hypothetical protein